MRNPLTTIVLLSLSAAASPQDPPRYAVTDLGDLGGGESIASSVNESGQIVGSSWLSGHTPGNACDERRAFLYEDGVMTELPSLPGTRYSTASAINDLGDASGTNDVYVEDSSVTGGCFPGYRGVQTPVLIRGGVPLDLSAPSPWYAGIAGDLNNRGQVVGWSWLTSGGYHGYLWENDVRTDLGTLGGWSIATDINEQSVVVGYSQVGAGSMGFRWESGQMAALPSIGGTTNNGANEINEAGDIVGWSGSLAGTEPALYPSSGGVVALGSLGGTQGSGFGINDAGIVVGYSYTTANQRHAILYESALHDLNDRIDPASGWELMAATGINNSGEIVGWGCKNAAVVGDACDNGGPSFRRAFLLTPIGSFDDIEDLILSFDLPNGIETSLLVKLAAARRAIEAGRIATGCALLRTLTNEVEAQSGKGLTVAQADTLLQAIRLLRIEIGCV